MHIRLFVLALAGISTVASLLHAQTPPSVAPAPPAPQATQSSPSAPAAPPPVILSDGGTSDILEGIDIPPIANAPFSGYLETDWVRPLADGGTWTIANRRRIAHDSSGRVYQERVLLAPSHGQRQALLHGPRVLVLPQARHQPALKPRRRGLRRPALRNDRAHRRRT